jgi:hypothetical protein
LRKFCSSCEQAAESTLLRAAEGVCPSIFANDDEFEREEDS